MRRIAATGAIATVTCLLLVACANDPVIVKREPTAGRPQSTTTDRPTTTDRVDNATAGATTLDDPITPGAGNGGYDVTHYDLELDIEDDRSTIKAVVTIEATATQDLSEFNLDLAGLTVESVTVGAKPATTDRMGDELTVTPSAPIANGAEFDTVVAYSGDPGAVPDPNGLGTIGWLDAPSGTFIAGEAVGAKAFLPCNNHPSDKATFTITVTASAEDTVVANGTLASRKPTAGVLGRTTWTYEQTDPMATYLIQIAIGEYEIVTSEGPHGLQLRDVLAPGVTPAQREMLTRTADQIVFFEPLFGEFPLDTYGVLVADAPPNFALETQTLTLLPRAWLDFGALEVSAATAHELSHQWFGDAVTPARWSDIWLNEGFATYAEWLWLDHTGEVPLSASVDEAMASAPIWRQAAGAVADPPPQYLFDANQYGGAAIVLHALRLEIGDDTFFTVLRTWVSEQNGKSVTTADFEATAATIAGRDLTEFFDAWLRSTDVPPLPG